MNVASLLPAFCEETFPELGSTYVGMLMAAFPIGYLSTAPLIGNYLGRIGRKNTIVLGVSLMTFSTLVFGAAGYFKNVWAFYVVSMVARALQGAADATCSISIPSVVAQQWPDKKSLYLGYYNMVTCCGFVIGPVMGSLVFGWLTYVNTFYFFTGFIFFFGYGSILCLPGYLNRNEQAIVAEY